MPRTVVTGPLPGPANMELDLALAAAAAATGEAILRLYAWDGPWVSLGYFQREERAVDAAGARARGVGIVRRPTGGKALLHDRDLTYSVALPASHPIAQLPLVASYRALSERLVAALAEVDIAATLGTIPDDPRPATERRRAAPCATEVHVETVLVNGKKLIGSAQVRRAGAVLQHGSIPLSESTPAVLSALLPPGQLADDAWLAWYHERTTTLPPELRVPLEAALIRAFADL